MPVFDQKSTKMLSLSHFVFHRRVIGKKNIKTFLESSQNQGNKSYYHKTKIIFKNKRYT